MENGSGQKKVKMTKGGFEDGDEEETGLDSLVSCETFEDSLLLSLHTFLVFCCWKKKEKRIREEETKGHKHPIC